MTMAELNDLSRTDWLISLWPLWLICLGVVFALIGHILKS